MTRKIRIKRKVRKKMRVPKAYKKKEGTLEAKACKAREHVGT